ncbi:MAG: hypothetical protein JST38_05855 [Bacteroidetes bacterium]|nr:hypothetical protein [Bacteroidota bacterium]MBS1940384.1 hypothetical protein [Bacteroidota bacterium]
MIRHFILMLGLLSALAGHSQAKDGNAAPPPPPVGPLQGGWNNRMANSQAAQWEAANSAEPGNAALQLNWLRSEQNAMAGNNNGELNAADKAKLGSIARNISATAPKSFEAHMANYYMEFPSAEAFVELGSAYHLAPEREEMFAPMLSKAMLDGDDAGLRTWSAEMVRRNAIAAPLQAAASDLLLSVAGNGILFTNGDMDTQPAVVEQVQQRDQPGVLVVDRRLLAQPAYRERTWQQAGATGAVPANGPVFAKALIGATKRPVYFALSLDRNWLDAFPGQLHAVGAAFRVGAAEPGDATALARNWSAMQKPLDAGPMSRNYLLPGAILLQHYRSAGEPGKAAQVEAELRKIAAATGGTQELRKKNVLNH